MTTSRSGEIVLGLLAVFFEAGKIMRRRGRTWLIGLVMAGVIGWLLHAVDHPGETWLQGHQIEPWMGVARSASWWGELHRAPLIALVVLALAGWFLRRWSLCWAALAGALSGATAGILVNVVKWFAGRPRPSTPIPDGFYPFHGSWDYASFPSGHATHTMAIVAAVAVLAPRSAMVFFAGAVLVIWSRWYLARHYPTDLWIGACLGLGIGLVFGWAARRVSELRSEKISSRSTARTLA